MENLKTIAPILIVLVIIWGGYQMFFSGNEPQEKATSAEVSELSQSDVLAAELARQYNAVSDWEEGLVYTIEAQERLLAGHPALFRGYIDDVFSRDGQTFIRFSSNFWGSASYVLELACDQHVVDKIMGSATDDSYLRSFDEFALVANIQEVSRPVFALEGSVVTEDEVEIDVSSPNLFTAKGTCVDVLSLGSLFDE